MTTAGLRVKGRRHVRQRATTHTRAKGIVHKASVMRTQPGSERQHLRGHDKHSKGVVE